MTTLQDKEIIALRVLIGQNNKAKLLPTHRAVCNMLRTVLKKTYPIRKPAPSLSPGPHVCLSGHFQCDVFGGEAHGTWMAADVKRNKRTLAYIIPQAAATGTAQQIKNNIGKYIAKAYPNKPVFVELAPEPAVEADAKPVELAQKAAQAKDQAKAQAEVQVKEQAKQPATKEDEREGEEEVKKPRVVGRNRPSLRSRPRK